MPSDNNTTVRVGSTSFTITDKVKLVLFVVFVGAVIWGVNYVRDMAKQNDKLTNLVNTITAEQKRLGDALTTSNKVTPNQEALLALIKAQVGDAVLAQIKKDGGKVLGLYSATGEVKESVGTVDQKVDALATTVNGLKVPYRGFTDRYILQDRLGAPALADLTLNYSYDPTNPDSPGALKGKWRNYRETFHPSLSTWTNKEGGYRAAFQLYRVVHQPQADGSTKEVKEPIYLTASDATFAPETFGLAPSVPRWTVSFGVAKELDGQRRTLPAALLDYRITNRIGVGGGVVGSQAVVLGSYRFGH
jgi:hypothetical protein